MKRSVNYNNLIPKKYLDSQSKKDLANNCENIISNIKLDVDIPNNTFHSLSKKFKLNFKLSDLIQFKKFKTVVIIGMGGSILGADAIYNFFQHKLKKNFIFIDDLDENKILNLKKDYNVKNILFLIISKSGNTLETLVNFFSFNIIKKNSKNIIIISEKGNNFLFKLSKKLNLFHIESRKYIGGRYSVLSETGLLPAYLMGVNITKLRKNLLKHFSKKYKPFLKDSCLKLANLIRKKKVNNIILLNYSPELNRFLYWVQQLIAESLGKNKKGFLPLISKAPTDHHSLLQLYLDGPRDKIFYIFSTELNNKRRIKNTHLNKNFKYLNNKNFGKIKNSQRNSLLQIFKKNKIPFREFKIKNFSEHTLGELFSYFMLEIAIIGKLVKINPYDQPAVEEVKLLTKKLLS